MNFYELIKMYAAGKSEKTMWTAIKRVSEFLETMKEEHPEKYWNIIKETYAEMCGPHYNEAFAMWQIEQMFYKDRVGNMHRAPHWTPEQYRGSFEAIRGKLKDSSYNCWDWAVTIEMQLTDNYCLLKTWWPNATEDEIKHKAVEMAIAYLNDDDDAQGGKIWRRFN